LPALFRDLCVGYHERGIAPRLLDVAHGMFEAAERAADPVQRANALNFVGVAYDLANEPARAVDAYRSALASDLSSDAHLRHLVIANLALALARAGSLEEAYRAFDEVIAMLVAAGNRTEEARTRWNFAKTLLDAGDPERALGEARGALELAREIDDPRAARSVEETVAQAERALDPDVAPAPASAPPPSFEVPEDEASPEALSGVAIAEWQAGSRSAARTHCAAAMAAYTARGDRVGVARCLDDLAWFAIQEEDLDEAATLTRRALNLRVIVGDLDGQLSNLASLADIEMHRGNADRAADAARRALVLAEGRLDERPAFVAAWVLVDALSKLGDATAAVAAARTCLEIGTRQNAPELAEAREDLEELASLTPAATPIGGGPAGKLYEELAEATRLARLGDVEETMRVIDHARASRELDPHEAGSFEGTHGIALQNAGRHREAAEAYATAAELLAKAGDPAQATNALQQRAVSLRLLGRLEDSEQALRAALAQAPSDTERKTIGISLANTLTERARGKRWRRGSLLQESRELLAPIAESSDDLERRGDALVGLSNVEALEGDLKAALQYRRAGLGDLRRVNSRHIDAVEAALRALERQAAARDA